MLDIHGFFNPYTSHWLHLHTHYFCPSTGDWAQTTNVPGEKHMQRFSLCQDLFQTTPCVSKSPSRLSLEPSLVLQSQHSQCHELLLFPTRAFLPPAPHCGLTLPNFLFERFKINSSQSDDCQIKTYCANDLHAAYQSQGDILWSVSFFLLGSQAFCGKRQVPVKCAGWVGPKINGTTGEQRDKSMQDADQSRGLVPVCSLDGEKNNTIKWHLFYSIH